MYKWNKYSIWLESVYCSSHVVCGCKRQRFITWNTLRHVVLSFQITLEMIVKGMRCGGPETACERWWQCHCAASRHLALEGDEYSFSARACVLLITYISIFLTFCKLQLWNWMEIWQFIIASVYCCCRRHSILCLKKKNGAKIGITVKIFCKKKPVY